MVTVSHYWSVSVTTVHCGSLQLSTGYQKFATKTFQDKPQAIWTIRTALVKLN